MMDWLFCTTAPQLFWQLCPKSSWQMINWKTTWYFCDFRFVRRNTTWYFCKLSNATKLVLLRKGSFANYSKKHNLTFFANYSTKHNLKFHCFHRRKRPWWPLATFLTAEITSEAEISNQRWFFDNTHNWKIRAGTIFGKHPTSNIGEKGLTLKI